MLLLCAGDDEGARCNVLHIYAPNMFDASERVSLLITCCMCTEHSEPPVEFVVFCFCVSLRNYPLGFFVELEMIS